jgi:transcriptional regulator with XRE-family HTH domain
MDFTNTGKRLRKQRLAQNLKQAELAEKTNLSIDYISKLERGERIPRLPNFIAILNELNISADEVLSDVLKKGYISRTSEYVRRIGELPKDEQERILEIISVYLDKR